MKITDVRVEHYRWPKAKPIANGKQTYTQIGFPGVETIKEEIEKALNGK